MRQRRITPRNPIRTTRQRRAHGASAGHHLYALRRCATSPSRRGASPSKKPPSSSHCANGAIHHHRRKTAEEWFNMLARGWLAYPVTPMHHPSTAEERLYKRHPGMRQRRITPRNPIRTTRQRRAHGASAGHHLYALRRCATSPLSAQCIAIAKKTATPRLAYPVTPCAIRRERSLRFPEAPLFALINYCFFTA